MGSSHSYLQNLELAGVDLAKIDLNNVKVMHLDDWCYMNDSAKAMKICSPEQMQGGKMKIKMDHLPHTMMAAPMTAHPMLSVPMTADPKLSVPMTADPKLSVPMTALDATNLQELSFGSWFHKEAHKADQDLHKVGHEAAAEFHKIDWKKVGAGAWHGIVACYQNEKCKAAVEKYGAKAVEDAGEDAAEAAALMNLKESGIKKFFTGGDNKAIKGFFQGKDDKLIDGEIKKLALGAWHGVEHCMHTEKCRAAVEKYGLLAVKIAVGVALAPVGALQNLCDGSDCNQMGLLQNMPAYQARPALQNLCEGSACNQMGFML